MKRTAFLIGSIVCAGSMASAGTVFYEQGFNTGPAASGSTYGMSFQAAPSTDPARHFTHSTSALPSYQGVDGGFVSGLYTDFYTTLPTPVLTTSSFSLDGNSTVQFAIDLAVHSSGSLWSSTSGVDFEYSTDGGSNWASIFSVNTNGSDDVLPILGGTTITRTFSTFTTSISGLSGTDMQVRVIWARVGLGESLGIDNLAVSVVPVPPAAFAGLGLLAGMGAYRRFRK